MLLEQFDPERVALINPQTVFSQTRGFPRVFVCPFSQKLLHTLVRRFAAEERWALHSANGASPIYLLRYSDVLLGATLAPVGAAWCAGTMEELGALGARGFVHFGSCGVLQKDIADGEVILPTSALRDEGTSYHYLPPSDEVALEERWTALTEQKARELSIASIRGKVWTTDAFYRETPLKVKRRKEAGCIAVEMECAALAAVSQFRGYAFAPFFYAADNLDAPAWDSRGLSQQGMTRADAYLDLAIEIAATMAKQL